MKKNEALKKDKERTAGDRFIKLHNSEGGHNFTFKESPRQDPPDLIYEDTKRLLLEITVAYYDQKHAKWLWDIERGIDSSEISFSPLIKEPTLSAYSFLNELIQKKCKGRFQYADPIFLVIAIEAFGMTTAKVNDFISSQLEIPPEVPFQEIWLLLNESYTMPFFEASVEKICSNLNSPAQERRFRLYPKS
ncbi:MAG: hypothetical protein A3H27_08765 [Acidobacteria bacterium RIFCSPLOWO2_02_FULL_59_13]|nr:MAG: hypothetical protein A3H27_08765 [Acidobacteria bacterium RIFCSPLOWO2_02_FULL_59_13]